MSIFKKIFGVGPKPISDAGPIKEASRAASGAGETVKVFDDLGRTLEMPKADWRSKVLLPNLAQKRANPEALRTYP